MNILKKIFLWILSCIFFLTVPYIGLVLANEDDPDNYNSNQEYISYIVVKPEFPENQINSNVSYLDLKMKPRQVQMIPIQVTNTFTETLTVYIRPETAVTGKMGRVVYQPDLENVPYDSSLTYPFTSISHISDDNITLAPNESKTINLILEMPEEEFDGTILGGVRFSTDNEFMMHAVDLTKENIDDYILGVRLVENEEDVSAALALQSVVIDHIKNKNIFHLNLRNISPVPIMNMHIEASIYKKNGTKQLYSTILEDWMMAPNSSVLLSLPLSQSEVIYPGHYTAIVNIASDRGEWELIKDFDISRKEARIFNEQVGNKLPIYAGRSDYLWLSIIIIILLIFILLLFKMIQKSKRKKQGIANQTHDKKKKKTKKNKVKKSAKEVKLSKQTNKQYKKSKKEEKKLKKKMSTEKMKTRKIPFKNQKQEYSYQVENMNDPSNKVLTYGKTSSIDLWSEHVQ